MKPHQSGTILSSDPASVGVDLEDKVGLPDARHHAGTGSLKAASPKLASWLAPAFDGDPEAELFQLLDSGRGRCDPGLTGETPLGIPICMTIP